MLYTELEDELVKFSTVTAVVYLSLYVAVPNAETKSSRLLYQK